MPKLLAALLAVVVLTAQLAPALPSYDPSTHHSSQILDRAFHSLDHAAKRTTHDCLAILGDAAGAPTSDQQSYSQAPPTSVHPAPAANPQSARSPPYRIS